jgi:hypothetical protein
VFWSKKSAKEDGKLSGLKEIPELVQKYLVAEKRIDPVLVRLLRGVDRKSANGAGLNIRVFDHSEAIAKKVDVKDYTSLDTSPDLILYEGFFDEGAKQVKLEEKTRVNWDSPIFTQDQIQQKIESLKEPGNTVFFYTARGGKHGALSEWGPPSLRLTLTFQAKSRRNITFIQSM